MLEMIGLLENHAPVLWEWSW